MEIINSIAQNPEGEIVEKLRNYLIKEGVETPINLKNPFKGEDQFDLLKNSLKVMLQAIGLDLEDPNIKDTPKRIAKLWLEIFKGLDYNNFPENTFFPIGKWQDAGIVRWDNITVNSWCEHHLLPITGIAKVAYIPNREKGLFGLSKINRIVDFFSSRPCTQERLTNQIFYTIKFLNRTNDIAVKIQAKHGCISCRGIKDSGSQVTTTKLGGTFSEGDARIEFINH